MKRREFIAGLGGAAAAAAIGGAAAWTYAARGHRVQALHLKILRLQANAAADKIASFTREIAGQINLITQSQLPWAAPPAPNLSGFTNWANDPQLDQRRFDVSRLLRQVPAITEIVQFDVNGNERLRESRFGPNDSRNLKISADDPEFVEAVGKNSAWNSAVYYGPVYVFRQSNHYMNMSFGGRRREAGVTVVKVSVRLIWEVVRQLKAGEHVTAYVLDAQGRVIAHSDDLNLFQHDFSSLPQVEATSVTGVVARDNNGREVLIAYAAVAKPAWTTAPLGWRVFVEIPAEEARRGGFVAGGTDAACLHGHG
jgi:hypothetical protein